MKKELEELLSKQRQALELALMQGPKILKEAADVIRGGDLKKFRKFLRRNDIVIMQEDAAAFRDYIVVSRVDLKDLEPGARARLRGKTLSTQEIKEVTSDYLQGLLSPGVDLRCCDCRWFVTAPMDNDGKNHDKSCVELGTKGVDAACYAFGWSSTQPKKA